MPRPAWSAAISFGLFTPHSKRENATERHDVSLWQVHGEGGGRIRYCRTCDIDGQVLTEGEIGKGYEDRKDHIIPITDQDLADMPPPTAKAIESVAFVDREGRRFADPRSPARGNSCINSRYSQVRWTVSGRSVEPEVQKLCRRGKPSGAGLMPRCGFRPKGGIARARALGPARGQRHPSAGAVRLRILHPSRARGGDPRRVGDRGIGLLRLRDHTRHSVSDAVSAGRRRAARLRGPGG